MAGFGVGIGDILALSKLGLNLYRGCKEANGAYDSISNEVDRFCSTVRSLQKTLPTQESIDHTIDRSQNHELQVLIHSAQHDLSQWIEVLHKHRKVGTRSKWANLRFSAGDDAATIQKRLASHSRSLTLFMSTLTSRRIQNIESHMERILLEVQNGSRDFSVEVEPEHDTVIGLEETQWNMLQDELLNDGFVQEDIASHRSWFEKRLQKVDDTPIPTKELTPPPTPSAPTKTSIPQEPVLRLRSANLTIQCENGQLLECTEGDEFAFVGAATVRPGRPDLWQCRHVRTSNLVTIAASCLEPAGARGTGEVFRQYAVSKGYQSSATLVKERPTEAPSRASRRSSSYSHSNPPISLSLRQSTHSRLSSETLTARDSILKPELDRRVSSDLARGRSVSVSNTPSRPPSRTHSVRSEISEYGADGKHIKTKTITTSYSSEIVPSNERRASVSYKRQSTRSEIKEILRGSEHRKPQTEDRKDYEALYKARTNQLKLVVKHLLDARLISSDPFSYQTDDVTSDDIAVVLIGRSVKSSRMKPPELTRKASWVDRRLPETMRKPLELERLPYERKPKRKPSKTGWGIKFLGLGS